LIESGLVHALHPTKGDPPAWAASLPDWVRNVPEIPEWLFWSVMVLIVVASMLYKPRDRGIRSDVPASEPSDGPTTA
jgi:hypothetical protein